MAINLTNQFVTPMLDCYAHESFTDAYAGKRYDFAGVKTITVYTSETVENTDYTRSGTTRYGTTTELGDKIQELTMEKDRSFTFTIDAGNAAEQMNIKKANERMQYQWKSVCTPEMDIYRLASWAEGKGLSSGNSVLTSSATTLSKSNVLEAIFKGNIAMNNELVPQSGRVLFMAESTALYVRLSDQVVGCDKLNGENITKGMIGTIDNTKVVLVPDSYMPSGVNFIIKNSDASVDPVKIRDYTIHHNPPGVNGDLVECRWMYDSFVLDAFKNGIYVCSAS